MFSTLHCSLLSSPLYIHCNFIRNVRRYVHLVLSVPFMNPLILSSSTASCGKLQKVTIHFANIHFQLPAFSLLPVSFCKRTCLKWLKYLFALLMHFESCKSRDSIVWLYTFFLSFFVSTVSSFCLWDTGRGSDMSFFPFPFIRNLITLFKDLIYLSKEDFSVCWVVCRMKYTLPALRAYSCKPYVKKEIDGKQ